MKEKIKKLIEKYEYKRERYNRLIYRPGFMTGNLRDFYDGVIEEYDFIKIKLNSILQDYDPCMIKIELALISQMAFNHYGHVTFPSNKKDIGKNRALFSIIEDMRELVKE